LVYIYTKLTIYTLRSKIFRNLSLFPKINPYCFNEADKRFNLYQPFVLRVLNDGFGAEGPASVVSPGMPMEIYNSSNAAFLAPASGELPVLLSVILIAI
jgi:hypothetical protein